MIDEQGVGNASAAKIEADAEKQYETPPGPGPTAESMNSTSVVHHEDLELAEVVQELNKIADKIPFREVVVPMCSGNMRFNPVTSLIGIVFLWGLSIYCMVKPEDAATLLSTGQSRITEYFTWFIVLIKPVFVFFLLFLYIRFGDIKLGQPEDEPEFSDLSYFAMLFSAGIAVGLFFFGVSEPLYYTQTLTPWTQPNLESQDDIDMAAINITLFNWGLHGWAPYVLLGIASSLMTYRYGLPLTFRSAFYPLLGGHTWGYVGDLLDGFAIVTVVAGVCTSLGLGAIQITQGLIILGWVDEDEIAKGMGLESLQAITIWVVTLFSTASVLSGLNVGIKYLSQLAFGMGCVIWFLVLVLDGPAYLFNLIVQSVGYYFQHNMLEIAFWTDAFGQLGEGEGRNIDDQGSAEWFYDAWINFYSFWFVSWAAFVSLFIARISKGRTIRSVIFWTMIGPLLYAFLWFCVFGGAGLRSQRRAFELQAMNGTVYNLTETPCLDVPATDASGNPYPDANISPVCTLVSTEDSWFNLMYQYYNLGPFLSFLSLLTIAIYFITSSDSGSLIVDHLASNGHEEHHWIQRVFWAFTEGAVATALLLAGGKQGLQALQAASVIAGLPFAAFMIFTIPSIYSACLAAEQHDAMLKEGSENVKSVVNLGKSFKVPFFGGVFNAIEVLFSGFSIPESRQLLGMTAPTAHDATWFFASLFLPPLSVYKVSVAMDPRGNSKVASVFAAIMNAILFLGWIIMFGLAPSVGGIIAFAWLSMLLFILQIATMRYQIRQRYNIGGNIFFDCLSSVVYPQVLHQLVAQTEGEAHVEEEE